MRLAGRRSAYAHFTACDCPTISHGALLDSGRGGASRGGLARSGWCTTLSYMKKATVTIRLDSKLQRELDRLCKQLGRSRSEVVRDALRRQIALLRFERSRRAILPLAEAQGILTDEDVFRIVS